MIYSYYYASVHMRKQGIYGSVFVCVCVCRLLQLLKDESSASKSFYRLLCHILFVDLQNKALFSSYA